MIIRFFLVTLCLLGFSPSILSATIDWQHTLLTPTRSDGTTASAIGPNDTVFFGGDAHYMFMGDNDYFVTKMDNAGNVLWHRTYGGNLTDSLTALAALPDGGVLAGGQSRSGISGDKSQNSIGGDDYWLLRLDSAGNIVWDITLGGLNNDLLSAISLTSDGNIVIAGTSYSSIGGDKSEVNRHVGPGNSSDIWLFKLDMNANILWQKTIGGTSGDHVFNGLTASANGSVLIGASSASGVGAEKTQANLGGYDYWLIQVDTHGVVRWDNTLGGSDHDIAYDVLKQRNGNIVVGGTSISPVSANKTAPGFNTSGDYWILALTHTRTQLWDHTLGGVDNDVLTHLTETLDDGILLAGQSKSDLSGNKTVASHGPDDYWTVKLDGAGQVLWQQVVGASGSDWFASMNLFMDGSFLLAGSSNSPADFDKTTAASNSPGDAWVVKLSEPLTGVSAFHFENPYGQIGTVFPCIGWDIYLNGAASKNEHNYYIDAWRRPIGSSQPFNWQASIGWSQGSAGLVNLTDSFAGIQPPGSPYTFAPGFEYQIKLAVQNTSHFAWVETVHTFVIPAQLHYCSIPTHSVLSPRRSL